MLRWASSSRMDSVSVPVMAGEDDCPSPHASSRLAFAVWLHG